MSKHFVSFYYRPSTDETFLVDCTSCQFNADICNEEEEGLVDFLKDSYKESPPSTFFKVSALIEVYYHKDYWGEVDVDYDVIHVQHSTPKSWSELRYIWGGVLCREGLLSNKEKRYFFKNCGKISPPEVEYTTRLKD